MNKRIVIIMIIVSASFFASIFSMYRYGIEKTKNDKLTYELQYYKQAEKINDYLSRFDNATRISVIRKTLKAIDENLSVYFPEGPFTRKDFIAIAMIESRFTQYKTGRYGEFGLFQILPESSEWSGVKKNQFDIRVNTDMAFFVLHKKYEKHKDYKMSIIAYNGVVKRRGKVSEAYWNKFVKYRRALDDILRDSYIPTR